MEAGSNQSDDETNTISTSSTKRSDDGSDYATPDGSFDLGDDELIVKQNMPGLVIARDSSIEEERLNDSRNSETTDSKADNVDVNANVTKSSPKRPGFVAERKRSIFKARIMSAMDSVDLGNCDLETGISTLKVPSQEKYTHLQKKIRGANHEWLEKFLQLDGLEALLDAIGTISHRRVSQLSDAMMLMKCIACVKEVMNSKIGFDHLIANKDSPTKLIKGGKLKLY